MNFLFGLTIVALFCNLYFIALGGEWSWGWLWICAEWHRWRYICIVFQHPREWRIFEYEEIWYDGPHRSVQIGPISIAWVLD